MCATALTTRAFAVRAVPSIRRVVARGPTHSSRPIHTAVPAMNLFGGLFGGGSKREGKNDDILKWARSASSGTQPAAPPADGEAVATVAGGCFWSTQLALERIPGVVRTLSGYTQGAVPSPTYEQVCSGRTGHTEGVHIYYRPAEVSYRQVLDVFFEHTDVTTLNRQGGDAGTQYRSGIYFHDDAQKKEAEAKVAEVQAALDAGSYRGKASGKKVVAEVLPAAEFWVAEDYHQLYLAKGGRFGRAQSAAKGCNDPIRCYG